MEQFVLTIHIIVSMTLIGLILIQQGKGADAGASFGSGASQTIFGSQGSGNFITKITAAFVTLFFITSLSLGYLMVNQNKPSDLDTLLKQAPQTTMDLDQDPAAGSATTVDQDDIPGVVPTTPTQ